MARFHDGSCRRMRAERPRVLDVRNGRVAFDDVLAEANDLQHRLEDLLQNSSLPERPDYGRVNEFLADAYQAWWKRSGG